MTDKIIGYVLTGIRIAFAVLGIIFTIMIFSNGEDTTAVAGPVGSALGLTYVGIFVCAVGALLFAVYFFATNFKKSIPALIGMLVFVVIILISYGMASDLTNPNWVDVTGNTAKWSGAGLITFYLLLGLSGLAVVASEVMRFIK